MIQDNTMIHVPAGTYAVGSTTAQREALCRQYGMHRSMLAGELPAQRVRLEAFHIDAFPVTNAQYAAFLAATGAPEPYDWPLHATAERAGHPVVGVGGGEAEAYARWVGKRLPTPEEWEVAFAGLPEQKDRTVAGGQWAPVTASAADDRGPRSALGLHGFGQVCEWTSKVDDSRAFPFRLLKGAAWMCEESWSLRPASAFYALAPWCRQWTGLRCVADRPVAPVPEAGLPSKAAPDYHRNPSPASDRVKLVYGGRRGMGVHFPRVGEAVGVAAPEGCLIDGLWPDASDWEDLERTNAADAASGTVSYGLRTKQIRTTFSFRAGNDYFNMDYLYTNLSDVDTTVQTSTCMNAGLLDVFYDLEGRRTFIWLGAGDWLPLRSLPRDGEITRWISYVTLPQPPARSVVVAVLGKDSPLAFVYARTGLAGPMALANNFCFSCLHLDPLVTVPAGGEAQTRARIYCMQGGLEDIRRRCITDLQQIEENHR